MGTDDDDVAIPVDIRYSHGSWSITSMLNPSNVINICESTNASVSIDFSRSECQNYYFRGALYVILDRNMDIFTLDDVSRYLDLMGNYSTSEAFSVIGCSEELGDMKANILFYGDEYHSATYSPTACALAVSIQP